ncbi:RND family efflux transporter, MFP subunit [Siphonobacter aquaeclarae]|uniref:RND family efflux transporter, MFP subunit n=2 Tax=Siphonobacter aquaeclarae TaxID=563176 RepID=A0A1G9YUK8_9BACT|nr:RND family efflux transporter, MFP subunit [Siphonobacter aquaeclarae]
MKIANSVYLVTAAGWLMSCDQTDTMVRQTSQQTPIPVTTVQIGSAGSASFLLISGQLTATRSIPLSTRLMGYITRLNVGIGDNVRAGQILFTVSASDIQAKGGQVAAAIAQAEAAAAVAEKDYERYKILHQQHSATDKELENVTLQYQVARAQVQSARQMQQEVGASMRYAQVAAPFSGTITQKWMDAGSLASPGAPVLTLESDGNLQATATLTEDRIHHVRKGMPVHLKADADGREFSGEVAEISRSSVGSGGQYLIKINLRRQQGLLPGMYVHIRIATKAGTGSGNLRVPVESLIRHGDLTGVYVVSADRKALIRWLRIGIIVGKEAEVLSGIVPGEMLVLHAGGRLWNGADVKL